jgi:hypothetical protein
MAAMNKLMLSCKKATELIEKKEVVGLSFIEKAQLKLHLSMCKVCASYGKHSKVVDHVLKTKAKSGLGTSSTPKMSDSAKAEILRKLGN